MDDYKVLYSSYGILDAKSIQLLLKSFNIESKVYQESAGVTLGLTVGDMGAAFVYVKNSDYDEAARIIKMMENGDLMIEDDEEILLDESEISELNSLDEDP